MAKDQGVREFFGFDHWVKDPTYHPEVALGSIFVMPGTNSVVATVFDPHVNAYSGGLHRYSTSNGELLGVKELYRLNTTVAFGKATGFGDIVATCAEQPIEIGNRVWNDTNKNGIQDAGELGLPNIGLVLYDHLCEVLGTTTTDEFGSYVFNKNNVLATLEPGAQFYVGIDKNLYDQNIYVYTIGGDYYSLSIQKNSEELVGNKAISTVAGCQQAQISVQTAQSNHNYDIGLHKASDCGMAIQAKILGRSL